MVGSNAELFGPVTYVKKESFSVFSGDLGKNT